MAVTNREPSIKVTLKWEGGYSNHPADPGGPTNYGITLADAKAYWKKNATALDVQNMPKDVAVDIYRCKYWKTPQYDCDKLDAGLDLCVFDFGVNSGPARAKKYLDGLKGKTVEEKINELCDKRLAFLRGLSIYSTFGQGWENRVKDIRKQALAMAKGGSSAGPVAGGVIIGGTAAAMNWPHYLPYIAAAAGLVIAAIIIYKIVRRKNVQ